MAKKNSGSKKANKKAASGAKASAATLEKKAASAAASGASRAKATEQAGAATNATKAVAKASNATAKATKAPASAQKKPAGKPAAQPKKKGGTGSNYLREVRQEMKRVSWPDRAQVVQSTIVVVAVVLFFALYVGVLDLAFIRLVRILTGIF
jgi:preprotein translocase subunit SecE